MAMRTRRFGITAALIAAALSGSTLTLVSATTATTAADEARTSTDLIAAP